MKSLDPINFRCPLWAAVLTSASFFINVTTAHAAGEECVVVENEIARLQCFDAAFAGTARVSSLTPDEAKSLLAELVFFESPSRHFILTSGDNACFVTSAHVRFRTSMGQQFLVIEEASTDLSRVERIGPYSEYGDRGSFVLYTERDFNSEVRRWTQRTNGAVPPASSIIPEIYQLSEPEYMDAGRDLSFYLVVEEYFPDSVKIRDALQTAVDVCRS